MKITFQSKATLFIVLMSLLGLIALKVFEPQAMHVFALDGHFNYGSWQWYLSTIFYVFGHENIEQFIGNMAILLLLGPIIELKYGQKQLLLMSGITAFVTGILHTLLWDNELLGCSGIVFMYIVLVTLLNAKGKEIPFTFILVVVLYLGQEIYSSFQKEEISHFAHLFGGAMGAFWGYYKK
jgi:membrane associated rhomboid family serine protease